MQPGLQPDVSMYSTVSGKHIDSLRIRDSPLSPCTTALSPSSVLLCRIWMTQSALLDLTEHPILGEEHVQWAFISSMGSYK